jgi:FkbM family methyltransferase
MGLIEYLRRKLERRKARRITREYSATVQAFDLPQEGRVEFANWDNPLVKPTEVTQEMVSFFKKFIKRGDMVIDIGANIGDTTVPMALAAGKEGITLGFDPNPLVFKILQKNATLNPTKQNIVPLRYAITVKEEEFYYVSSEASFGNGGISPVKQSHHGKFVYPEKIKGINLQKYLETNYPDKVSNLSFIKIDTEGYDKEILKSIADLVKKYKPVVVAESFGKSSNEDKAELFNIFDGIGYDVYFFEDFHVNADTIRINNSREMSRWKKTINIYGVPRLS